MNNYDYIAKQISHESFISSIVLPFTDKEGRPCIFIKNSRPNINTSISKTDSLEYHLNSVIQKDDKEYYFHIICCLKSDEYSKEQFSFAYKYLFEKITEPQSDGDIRFLIQSLEDLFKTSEEKDLFRLHIGVYGELLFLLHSYECGCKQILSKYHSNFKSKHDYELDRNNRIEIKSTVNPKRVHHFSHDQIFRKDIQVYVVSIVLEESLEGVSLEELFMKVLDIVTDASETLKIAQLKGYCGISADKPGPSFSFDKALDDLRVFNAIDLPHLELESVKGVTNISYEVDCSAANDLNFNNFLTLINSIIDKPE